MVNMTGANFFGVARVAGELSAHRRSGPVHMGGSRQEILIPVSAS